MPINFGKAVSYGDGKGRVVEINGVKLIVETVETHRNESIRMNEGRVVLKFFCEETVPFERIADAFRCAPKQATEAVVERLIKAIPD